MQSLNPDLSLILDAAAAWFSEPDPLESGDHDPDHTGFDFLALELSAGAAVDPYFRFDANLVFGPDGAEVEEAYGTTLDLPLGLQARFGQMLSRFGRTNATHPHAWDFVDQPFALGRLFGSEGNRGLGPELSWLTPLPWYVELVGFVTEATGADTARSFYGATDHRVSSLGDLLSVAAIKQFFPLGDDLSLFFGLSGAFGPNATGPGKRSEIYGVDAYLKYRPISSASESAGSVSVALTSEWMFRRRELPGDVLVDLNGYAQLAAHVSKRWGIGTRYELGTPSYGRDGHVSLRDPVDPDWTERRERIATNVTYWPTEFSRFRLQASRDLPGFRPPASALFFAVELVTGAHGAHPF